MKVLEVNNTDLKGRRFNGYDLISDIKDIDINQIVVEKDSSNKKVFKLINNINEYYVYSKFYRFETENSLQNIFSITTPSLMNSKIYKKSDIIHFHQLHNSKLSLYSLIRITNEKKTIISLHDPWMLTGRCVHFYNCNKWMSGCDKCQNLNTEFKYNIDNANMMWNLKRNVINKINTNYVISSNWMKKLTNNIIDTNIIPFGIDTNKLKLIPNAKERYNIKNTTLFFRSQESFKGTNYIIEALDKYVKNKDITIITCDAKGMLNNLKDRYRIIELGIVNNDELFYAYSACDMFLMPSTSESFGMMAIEAMSFSKPVIIFDNTALPTITHATECGYLVENENSQKLAEAIDYLIENEVERIRRGNLARKIAVEEYDINNYLSKIEKLYQNVQLKKNNIDIKPTNNDNVLYMLNNMTHSLFKNNKITKELLYECKIDNTKIDYSDLEVQERIYQYCNKIYELINNNHIYIPIKYKIKWIIENNKHLKKIYKEKRLWRK